jgi:uncharacterized protein (DUF488 family)
MEIYTTGFTKKTAGEFFESLRRYGIKRLIDVRLNNISQLAAFSKRDDLSYFLKEICGAEYIHEQLLAPTQDMLDVYKKHKGSWDEYAQHFLVLMAQRKIEDQLDKHLFDVPTVLLCSEHKADHCHRRLVAEYLGSKWGDLRIAHI